MAYSTDNDLLKVQKDILELGVDDWTDQHNEAALIIDRAIYTEWFMPVAKSKGYILEFNPDLLLLPEQLLRLSVYKTLELAYLFLMQDFIDENPKESKWNMFRQLYDNEFKNVLSFGLSYDWDGKGTISQDTSLISKNRVIFR